MANNLWPLLSVRVAIMTSKPLSVGDSSTLPDHPVLIPHFVLRTATLERDSEPQNLGKHATDVAPYSATTSVRFHTIDMVDHESFRSIGDSVDDTEAGFEGRLERGSGCGRLTAPRMSLLGRPINYRATRRDARYRRLQTNFYNFLERPRGFYAITYHMIVFCMVFMCLVLSVFSTIDEYEREAGLMLYYMELIVVIWFGLEFCLRLWSSGCRSRYQTAIGRLKFLRRPFCIIDIITIAASIVVLAMRSSSQVFAASALRGLRFFQILRMVRMDRRGGTWKLLGSVVYAHRQELITTLYIGFLGLIFASFLVYLAERDDEHFDNYAKALWWGVITLCTVGYGDAVPKTWQGKIIASFCALLGISFFALPAGILGSGFALKVQQQQRQKHMIRRRQPAATLIQALWRCYAADENSISTATWKIHQKPLSSPPRLSSSFKHNTSFVSRLPTIRRHKSTPLHSPGGQKLSQPNYNQRFTASRVFTDLISSAENLGVGNIHNGIYHDNPEAQLQTKNLNASYSEDSVAETALSKKNSDDEEEVQRCVHLTNQHKTAIRAIRKLKYFVARKKFREALKPYDVKDVIEQYSSGHADLLNRVRNLQFRLDQILGKQGSKARDVYVSKISLASRVVKVERQVDDIETKLDQLIELYIEDRERPLSLPMAVPRPCRMPYTPFSTKSEEMGVTALKPILVDKQLSEPSSPTSKTRRDSKQPKPRQMHRGYSDLSNRVKKRVTLSSIASNFVHSDEPPTMKRIPSYSTSPVSSTADEEIVIIVPTLSENRVAPNSILRPGPSYNGELDESIITIESEVDPSEESEYNNENETEDLSSERAALLGASGSTLTILPSSIDPGGSTDQP